MSSTVLSWEYEGEHAKTADGAQTTQSGTLGAMLEHDIFGECKLLGTGEGFAPGSFKVQVLSDGSERELTKGHFKLLATQPETVTKSGTDKCAEPTASKGGSGEGKDEGAADVTIISGNAEASTAAPVVQPEEESAEAAAADGSTSMDGVAAAGIEADGATTQSSGDANADPLASEPTDATSTASDPSAQQPAGTQSPIYEVTVSAVTKQVVEYHLESDQLELRFYKSLVLLDFSGVCEAPEMGGNMLVRSGSIVRERTTGFFFVITRMYKPLPGFLVDKEHGLFVDEEGDEHTLRLAKSSRVLGGNKGHFSGEPDAVIVCLRNPRFGSVWMGVNLRELKEVFDLGTPSFDKADAICEEYGPLMSSYPDEWETTFHKKLEEEELHGGGIILDETALKPTSNLYALFRRRRCKPYQTKSEAASAAEVTEVPPPAAADVGPRTRRKRTPAQQPTIEVSDDDDKKGQPRAKRARAAPVRSTSKPAATPNARAAPKPRAQAQPRPPPSTPISSPPRCDDYFETELAEPLPPPTCPPLRPLSPTSQNLQQQQPRFAANNPAPPQPMPASAPASTPAPATIKMKQQVQQPDRARATDDYQQTQQTPMAQQQMQQTYSVCGAGGYPAFDPRNFQQQGSQPPHGLPAHPPPYAAPPFTYGVPPHIGAHLAQAGQYGYPSGYHPAPYHYLYPPPPVMPLNNFAPSPPFGPLYFNGVAQFGPPPTPAPAENKDRERVSPSLAAIQARIHYQNKKKEDLLDSQIMHEYFQEKYGVKK